METAKKTAFPLAGVIFLVLAAYEFLTGDDWVVWAILGILLGGLGVFNRKPAKDA